MPYFNVAQLKYSKKIILSTPDDILTVWFNIGIWHFDVGKIFDKLLSSALDLTVNTDDKWQNFCYLVCSSKMVKVWSGADSTNLRKGKPDSDGCWGVKYNHVLILGKGNILSHFVCVNTHTHLDKDPIQLLTMTDSYITTKNHIFFKSNVAIVF